MPFYALGLNHHSAPIAIRERFAFDPQRVVPALQELCGGVAGVSEAAILSTCNRTELYVAAREAEPEKQLSRMNHTSAPRLRMASSLAPKSGPAMAFSNRLRASPGFTPGLGGTASRGRNTWSSPSTFKVVREGCRVPWPEA